MPHAFDALILGSGAAGLTAALKLAEHGRVAVVTKRERMDGNTRWAQGGISVVVDSEDSFAAHIKDTIIAGDGLNDREAVRICVEEGPARLQELLDIGVHFTTDPEDATKLDLTREGGHSARRVVHAKDTTGRSIAEALVATATAHPNITFFEFHHAIDLITRRRLGDRRAEDRCLGAYVLDEKTRKIEVFRSKVVVLATGGAGKVYRYTSNPDVATGDGIAMAYRAGCAVANMEFFQFHPTCLYHPAAKNFLITEACRGEGGILRRLDGHAFMVDYDERKDLAPRDIVARAIDSELKRTGDPHVLLDMTHLDPDFIRGHFPGVSAELLTFGIDMTTTPIPRRACRPLLLRRRRHRPPWAHGSVWAVGRRRSHPHRSSWRQPPREQFPAGGRRLWPSRLGGCHRVAERSRRRRRPIIGDHVGARMGHGLRRRPRRKRPRRPRLGGDSIADVELRRHCAQQQALGAGPLAAGLVGA
jgi:L-aspartate oxidase